MEQPSDSKGWNLGHWYTLREIARWPAGAPSQTQTQTWTLPPDQRLWVVKVQVLLPPNSQHKLCGVWILFKSVTDVEFEQSEGLMPLTDLKCLSIIQSYIHCNRNSNNMILASFLNDADLGGVAGQALQYLYLLVITTPLSWFWLCCGCSCKGFSASFTSVR